jgi:hypothetical protein
MPFEIFLQAFEKGEAVDRDGTAVRTRLLQVANRYEPEHRFVEVGDHIGSAEVYGVPDESGRLAGLTFSRVDPRAFDLLVEVARMADLVVMPPGCPVCIVREEQRQHLPPELERAGVELVAAGEGLRAVIERR